MHLYISFSKLIICAGDTARLTTMDNFDIKNRIAGGLIDELSKLNYFFKQTPVKHTENQYVFIWLKNNNIPLAATDIGYVIHIAISVSFELWYIGLGYSLIITESRCNMPTTEPKTIKCK